MPFPFFVLLLAALKINTICVHIRGRECQNLSIVDLPGLIQSVDKAEDERYIHLVEGLVKEYLQSDKTVILQCFQSDEDIEVRT